MPDYMKKEIKKYRDLGVCVTDEEANMVSSICDRKMEISGIEDKEGYKPLLFADEIKYHIIGKLINAVTTLGRLEAEGIR